MIKKAIQHNLVPIIGISPISLDNQRKELDIPLEIRTKLGKRCSFKDSNIKNVFKTIALDIAHFKVPYLCLATEINFLALGNLKEFLRFVKLYKNIYKEVKKISQKTRIFVSFQWDVQYLIDTKELEKVKEHSKIFEIFKPQLDFIALTSYPINFFRNPIDIPRDYYISIDKHIDHSDKVLFLEIGCPTRGLGSEESQVAFVKRLPILLRNLNLIGIDWALLHDVNIPEFDEDLRSLGLFTDDGKEKLGFESFNNLKKYDHSY
ncbi:MAG: hypothetical protein BAJALOKI1v1_20002 [Promethearchaeota archaeon]|nr:MAG: hypothetical protein BAJALOKI1v1_20002 [Candidatus Lokiarchaeota archaeon]